MRFLFLPILLAACGGGGGLNPAFDGTWTGAVTIAPGGTQYALAASIDAPASGWIATVGGVCPGGAGSIPMFGPGDELTADDWVMCGAAQVGSCATSHLSLAALTLAIKPAQTAYGWALHVSGDGVLSGCGAASHVTVSAVVNR